MTGVERRSQMRFTICVPMRVRGVWQALQEERVVHSLNISSRGTCFVSEQEFHVGERINVCLKMPELIVAGQGAERSFTGRVTHVPKPGSDEKNGIGVCFLCYADAGTS